MQEHACVGTGRYEISKDPAAMQQYSGSSAAMFQLIKKLAVA